MILSLKYLTFFSSNVQINSNKKRDFVTIIPKYYSYNMCISQLTTIINKLILCEIYPK